MAKLTKTFVDKIEAPTPGKTLFYFDDELTGFGLRVSGKTKTYFCQAYVSGRKVRHKIDRHPNITAEEARKKAQRKLGQMAEGRNLNEEKKVEKKQGKTLQSLYEEYKEARLADVGGGLRPKTLSVYESALRRCFPDWLELPISSITDEMVIERYRQLATKEGKRSRKGGARAQAAQAMRLLRSLLNFAGAAKNPIDRLNRSHRGWSRVDPRTDVIDPDDLKSWREAVDRLPNPLMRDYLLFCLFSGLRRGAAAKLTWENIDLRKAIMTIPAEDDKMRKERRLPLSSFLKELLEGRAKIRKIDNGYVFPGDAPGEYIQEPKRAIAKVVEKSGVKFSMHTLRRTFATTAEHKDISHYKLKELLGHSLSRDVTAHHYVNQISIDDLRDPMQLITDYFEQKMGLAKALKSDKQSNRA